MKTKEEISELYKKAVQSHMENKKQAAHPLDASIFHLFKDIKQNKKVIDFH